MCKYSVMGTIQYFNDIPLITANMHYFYNKNLNYTSYNFSHNLLKTGLQHLNIHFTRKYYNVLQTKIGQKFS